MDLGAVGKDGRTGGRLERELEVYEQALMQKRKGARDRKSNKARESTGTGIDGGDEADEDERGEPSNKRARRMDQDEEEEEDPDEENRMLDLQLNGLQGEQGAAHDRTTKATRRKVSAAGSSPTAVEKGNSKGVETDSDLEINPEGDEEEEDNDEDDEENNDDDDDEGDDDEEDQDDDANDEAVEEDQLEGRNGARSRNGHGGLLPNGRGEIEGSDEDSD